MIKRTFPFFLFALLSSFCAFSQITMPKLAPISPTAASLYKFADYPVSLNTGLVDISVPIHNIERNGIKIPISLKYHASGIKYNDVSGNIGIGWTLIAGGMITGTEMGIPDNPVNPDYNFFKLTPNIDPLQSESIHNLPTDGFDNDNHKLIDVIKEIRDSEYDIYSYSFLNYSGKFFYPGTVDPVFSPRRNFKVTTSNSGSSIVAKKPFIITDEEGITYRFGKDLIGKDAFEQSSGTGTSNLNFVLTEIISADKSDTIRFTYEYVSNHVQETINKFAIIDNYVSVYDNHVFFEGAHSSQTETGGGARYRYEGFTYQRLDQITYKGGRVAFSYDLDNKLIGVKVFNSDTQPIKSVKLTQSQFGNDYYKLDSVKFLNVGTTKSYFYKFDYNATPNDRHQGIDYWGYSSGADKTPPLLGWGYVPNFSLTSSNYPAIGTADRTPTEAEMLKGMLTKVTYPTGGYSTFAYEAHRYGSGQIAGGLRIQEIVNFSASGITAGKKLYKYGLGESGIGTLFRSINPDDYCSTQQFVTTENTDKLKFIARERTFHSFPLISNVSGLGSSVTYDYVTEYSMNGVTPNGKTVYIYENFMDQTYASPYPMNVPPPMIYRSNAWKTGNLKSKITYRQDGKTLSKVNNFYKDINYSEYACLKVTQYLNWPETNWPVGFSDNTGVNGYDQHMEYFLTRAPLYGNTFGNTGVFAVDSSQTPPKTVFISDGIYLHSPYSYANYLLSSGSRVLDYSVEMQNDVTRTITYTYEGTYDKPRTVTTTQSDEVSTIRNITYTFDKMGEPYTTMVMRNMLLPVEESSYKGVIGASNLLQSTRTDFSFWTAGQATTSVTDQIYPKIVFSKKGTDLYEPRLEYLGYDADGNILSARNTGGPSTSYIWGYEKQYPIAQVSNAALKDVFYEGFEAGTGNTAYNDAKTGRYSKTGGYVLAMSGLTSGQYTLSYWSKSGSAWFFNISTVTVSSPNYVVSLTGQVDDIRFHPKEAHMVTYTFDRQVGQTSMTDAKNVITYFVYDDFGQLVYIQDKDKNIVKAFCYNYAGQAVNCFAPESPPPVIVYARLERTMLSPSTTGDPNGEHWTNSSANYQIKFYSNAQTTSTLILPSSQTMRVKEQYYIYNSVSGTSNTGEYINTYTAPAGFNYKTLGTLMMETHHYYFDAELQNYYDDYYWYNYTLSPGAESNYIILTPTY